MRIIAHCSLTAALFVLGVSSVFGQAMPQNFVSVTPCRIADTRTVNGGAGPIPGGTYQNFGVYGAAGVDGGPACNIPANASAYSLNVTAVPPSGSSLLYLSVLPGTGSAPSGPPSSSTLNDPSGTIIANAAIVPSGVNGSVEVYVSSTSDVILDIDGYFVDQTGSSNYATAVGTGAGGSTGTDNTAVGYNALASGSGGNNTAVGYTALMNDTTGGQNTAVGLQALLSNTSGSGNAAVGYKTLYSSTTGAANSAFGYLALSANITGGSNTAYGYQSLENSTAGSDNIAVGVDTLINLSTGSDNIAMGSHAGQVLGLSSAHNVVIGSEASSGGYGSSTQAVALTSNTTAIGYQALYLSAGGSNTAVGYEALHSVQSGTSNTALGASAGSSISFDGSNNIDIANNGVSGDDGVIRIGTQGTQTSTYMAGISGVTVTGSAVLVNSSGQLGVQSSSIRFKENVHDMAAASDALMQLRPVKFQYKQAEADGTKPLQFGLVAEEVANVYPELVVRGKDGQVDTVQYHQLPAMLLNEIQKQHRTIEEMKAEIEKLRSLLVKDQSR